MAQYINKDTLVAELNRLIAELVEEGENTMFEQGRISAFEDVKVFINHTLEVKEEILDKEGKTKLIKKCVHKAYKRGYDMGVLQTTNKMNHNAKKVDLEKEIKEQSDKYYSQCEKKLQEMGDDDNDLSFLSLDNYAKYFFELGLKAQKGKISYVPNIDDSLKELGVDPDSKEAKIFKESYYTALEKLKAQKG